MPTVLETDSSAQAQRAARALKSAGIYGQVKIFKQREWSDIGTRQLPYSVWVANDQGGTAAATLNALFKRRRR